MEKTIPLQKIDSSAKKQRSLLENWLPYLSDIPEIDLIWIEGSMVNNERENPGSDIDIRFAIQDHAFDELWESNRKKVFEGLGETYPLAHFRLVTEDGILIESDAFKTSEIIDLPVYEWEILLNRLPDGQPVFKSDSAVGAKKWPHRQGVTLESVQEITPEILRRLSTASTPFYNSTPHSALFELDLLRLRLMNFLYWRGGVQPFMRAKHLEQVLPVEFLNDYAFVQFEEQENSLSHASVAKATLRTFEKLIKHIKEIYTEVGGESEYPDKWFRLLYQQLESELNPFIEG